MLRPLHPLHPLYLLHPLRLLRPLHPLRPLRQVTKLIADRERSNRVVIEFFSRPENNAEGRTGLVVGMRLVKSPDEPDAQVGR